MTRILRYLSHALTPDWPALTPEMHAIVSGECAEFVRAQIVRAPPHIRLGIVGLLAIFRLFLLLRIGPLPLSRIPPDRLAAAFAAFSFKGPDVLAMLERALRSMILAAYFDQTAVLNALNEPKACLKTLGYTLTGRELYPSEGTDSAD